MSDLLCIFLLLQHLIVEFFPQVYFKFSLRSTSRFLFLLYAAILFCLYKRSWYYYISLLCGLLQLEYKKNC
jgi:hypothetical protein